MPVAEFEEKQYEVPADIELGLQHAAVFAPGQVLEAVVGYDAATNPPQNAPIWKLVGTNAPQGLLLVPNLWQKATKQPKAPELPSSYVSLILQYKRPQFLKTSLALQWYHWKAPYYRFEILQHQQNILEILEGSTAGLAEIRYASPAFWQFKDLQTHQLALDILGQSTFVAPSILTGHKYWTYQNPGTVGFPNPSKRPVATETFDKVWEKLKTLRRRKKENLFDHLRGLASGGQLPESSEKGFPAWLDEFNKVNDLELTPQQRQGVVDAMAFGNQVGEAGSSWFVVDLDEPVP